MSWLDAKNDARLLVAALPLPAGGLDGRVVELPQYADALAFRAAISGHPWSFEYFQMVQRAEARLLRARGATVKFKGV